MNDLTPLIQHLLNALPEFALTKEEIDVIDVLNNYETQRQNQNTHRPLSYLFNRDSQTW